MTSPIRPSPFFRISDPNLWKASPLAIDPAATARYAADATAASTSISSADADDSSALFVYTYVDNSTTHTSCTNDSAIPTSTPKTNLITTSLTHIENNTPVFIPSSRIFSKTIAHLFSISILALITKRGLDMLGTHRAFQTSSLNFWETM